METTLIQMFQAYGIPGIIIVLLIILIYKFSGTYLTTLGSKIAELNISKSHKFRADRKNSIQKINFLLGEILKKFEADRAVIFEYHNGGQNLTGFPFLHMTATIQKNKLGVGELSNDFQNMMISQIPDFINKLDQNAIFFVDNISSLSTVFPSLYKDFRKNKIKKALFCSLNGSVDQIGFLLIAFGEDKINNRDIMGEIFRYTQQISSILDLSSYE